VGVRAGGCPRLIVGCLCKKIVRNLIYHSMVKKAEGREGKGKGKRGFV